MKYGSCEAFGKRYQENDDICQNDKRMLNFERWKRMRIYVNLMESDYLVDFENAVQNEPTLAIRGVDTAENEPSEVGLASQSLTLPLLKQLCSVDHKFHRRQKSIADRRITDANDAKISRKKVLRSGRSHHFYSLPRNETAFLFEAWIHCTRLFVQVGPPVAPAQRKPIA